MHSKFCAITFFLLLCSCSSEFNSVSPQEKDVFYKLDTIKLSNYGILEIEERIKELTNDSLKNVLFLRYANYYGKLKDSVNFRTWNNKGLNLATLREDTIAISKAYWLLGNFMDNLDYSDSSYYFYQKAYHHFDSVKEELNAGKVLLHMAILQKNIKDYEGSEITTVQAIKKVKPIGAKSQLYAAYNNLGIIRNELKDYSKAQDYHQKALNLAETLADTLLIAASLNNIGVAFKENIELHEAADSFRRGLLIPDLKKKDAELYAMLLDNLGHTENLLNDFSNKDRFFKEALEIRVALGHEAGITINKLHLSEYYLKNKDTASALIYGYQARNLAQETNNFRDLLRSLLLLSNIDSENSQNFLSHYIRVNDSLQHKERLVRNKFARIRFETDEFIAQNQQLTEQNKLLIGSSAGGIVLSFLTIMVFRQKARNRRLKNERDQQKANEDIYKLLLDQENKIEEGKSKEKERISRELHDGVLSKMFGIRFTLSHLNSKYDETSIETKQKHLDDLRQIEQEIRLISHDLQKNQFEEVGFLKILRHLMEDQALVMKFSPSLRTDSDIPWERISNPVKMNLYRIIQEALQNIYKYAGASEAEIDLKLEVDCLKVSISDNGQGFDVEKKVRGIGLINMKSRVKEINGSFRISSSETGTVITLEIPISHD